MVVAFNIQLFSQNEKCLTFSNIVIKNVNGKIINQYTGYDQNTYTLKVEVPSTYDFEKIKMACDTTKPKVVIDWKANYDKNWEKQLNINGKIMTITFYPNDKNLYFEFPKY